MVIKYFYFKKPNPHFNLGLELINVKDVNGLFVENVQEVNVSKYFLDF